MFLNNSGREGSTESIIEYHGKAHIKNMEPSLDSIHTNKVFDFFCPMNAPSICGT